MNTKSDAFRLIAVMLGGILLALAIIFIFINPSSTPNSNANKSSGKLLSSVIVKPVKIDTSTLEKPIYNSTPTISVDSQLRVKHTPNNTSSHQYSFDGMIGKPWSYYKVADDRLIEIPNDKTLIPIMKQWNEFILSIRDVNISTYPDSASIIITDNKGDRHYQLKKAEPQKYLLDNGQSKLLLVTRTSLVCELYFIFGNDAASVSNMNWEIENNR